MTLYEEIYKLKRLVRTGWLMRFDGKIERLESDAEHIFSVIVLALEIMEKNDLKIDPLKVVKMLAYHELCEIDVKDFTPFDNITKEQKHQWEYECIHRLAIEYDMQEIEDLWLEFEENKTPEAQFCQALDHYDAVKQAKIYETECGESGISNEFYLRCKEQSDYVIGLEDKN